MVKVCTKCKEREARADHSWCQECLNANRREYYKKNQKKEIAAKTKWQLENPDKKKQHAKTSYVRNRTKRLEDMKTYGESHRANMLFVNARRRAKSNSLEFSITLEYIAGIIPNCCPVFETPWRQLGNGLGPDSMTLDRIDSTKGYTPGNVAVISHRANSIKRDASASELRQVTNWLESQYEF